MTNKKIAKVLQQIAALLEINGENTFKTRAYTNAARRVDTWESAVADMVGDGRLGEIPGLGKSMVEKITELVRKGSLAYYDDLADSVPEGLREMLSISGLGSKKVRAIREVLGIETVGELEYACRENRLVALEGFGQKTQERVLSGIELLKRSRGHHLLNSARAGAELLESLLLDNPAVIRVGIAGEVRRQAEIVKEIQVVVSGVQPDIVKPGLSRLGPVEVLDGETITVTLETGIVAFIHCVREEAYPFALYHWTGSDAHREQVARYADTLGLTLTDRLISRSGTLLDCVDEEDFYRVLGLSPIPPELREGEDEVALAQQQQLPELVTRDSLKGVIHVHTRYSDGADSVSEMAEAARLRGFSYVAICDHSRFAAYAHGLDIDRVKAQHEEIDKLNEGYEDFRIIKGIESDILPDGNLDYPEEILQSFDLIVASVHSVFNMSEENMTSRIVKAIQNPYTTILGHPTGRLLLARDGYSVDITRIIDEAIAHNVAIEVNANPHRLDLDWRHLRYAKDNGAMISIGPDAHQISELDYVTYGIGMARKGGLIAGDLLNAMSIEELTNWIGQRTTE